MSGRTPKVRTESPEPALLAWHEAGKQRYVGGDYEIALVEPSKWEITRGGAHVEFVDSRTWSFLVAENHYRETLRARDLRAYGTVAVAAAAGLLVVLILTGATVFRVLVLGALWVAHVWGVIGFIYTLARIGRLRGGARYATPFGRSTYRVLRPGAPPAPGEHPPLPASPGRT